MRNKTHKCEKCGHNFTYAWNLKQHLKHNKNCGSLEEKFKCSNCGKNFTLSATLKHHFARCIAVDPHIFACSHCSRKFTFKSSLRKHMRERCPNMNYDSAATQEDESNCDVEHLEEVHIDEIDFKYTDEGEGEFLTEDTGCDKSPPQLEDEASNFTIIETDDVDENEEEEEESDMEIKFTYDDSCSEMIEFLDN